MNKLMLGTSVAALLVACPAPRPAVTSSPVGTRLACAEKLATALGFTDASSRTPTSVSLRRYRHEGTQCVTQYYHQPGQSGCWDELLVQATDSTVSVRAGSFPAGTVPSQNATLAAERIRRECGT